MYVDSHGEIVGDGHDPLSVVASGTDPVKSPAHYLACGGVTFKEIVMSNDLDFAEASVIKYILRFPYKGQPIMDLEKAKEYVEWLIEREKENGND